MKTTSSLGLFKFYFIIIIIIIIVYINNLLGEHSRNGNANVNGMNMMALA